MTKPSQIIDILWDDRMPTPGSWRIANGKPIVRCPECCEVDYRLTERQVRSLAKTDRTFRMICSCGMDRVCRLNAPPPNLKGGLE